MDTIDGSDQIYAGPDGTALRFFTQPSKNNFQSEKNGRAVYDTSLMVDVMVPGSRESTPQFEVERTYCVEVGADAKGERLVQRTEKYDLYKKQIEAFKEQSGEHLTSGTPLGQWANVDAGTVASLRAVGIYTVEQLAAVNDGNLGNLGMGGRVLREQAAAWMQSRQFGVPSAQMAAENANLRDENTAIKAQMAAMSEQMRQLTARLDGTTTPPKTDGPQATFVADNRDTTFVPAGAVDPMFNPAPPAPPAGNMFGAPAGMNVI